MHYQLNYIHLLHHHKLKFEEELAAEAARDPTFTYSFVRPTARGDRLAPAAAFACTRPDAGGFAPGRTAPALVGGRVRSCTRVAASDRRGHAW